MTNRRDSPIGGIKIHSSVATNVVKVCSCLSRIWSQSRAVVEKLPRNNHLCQSSVYLLTTAEALDATGSIYVCQGTLASLKDSNLTELKDSGDYCQIGLFSLKVSSLETQRWWRPLPRLRFLNQRPGLPWDPTLQLS